MSGAEAIGLGLALGLIFGGLRFVWVAIRRDDVPLWLRYSMSALGWTFAWIGSLVALGILA